MESAEGLALAPGQTVTAGCCLSPLQPSSPDLVPPGLLPPCPIQTSAPPLGHLWAVPRSPVSALFHPVVDRCRDRAMENSKSKVLLLLVGRCSLTNSSARKNIEQLCHSLCGAACPPSSGHPKAFHMLVFSLLYFYKNRTSAGVESKTL